MTKKTTITSSEALEECKRIFAEMMSTAGDPEKYKRTYPKVSARLEELQRYMSIEDMAEFERWYESKMKTESAPSPTLEETRILSEFLGLQPESAADIGNLLGFIEGLSRIPDVTGVTLASDTGDGTGYTVSILLENGRQTKFRATSLIGCLAKLMSEFRDACERKMQ